ncbi:MAG TPA: hypothetical protein VJA21_01145 [Verrucomicrobiae bacterium]
MELSHLADTEAAYNRDHCLEPVQGFDFETVFTRLDGAPDPELARDERITNTAAAVRQVLIDVVDPGRGRGRFYLDTIARRVLCLSWLLQVPGVGDLPLAGVAANCRYARRRPRVTKEAFSKAALRIGDAWGLRCRGQKSPEARLHYAAAQKANHWRHKLGATPATKA